MSDMESSARGMVLLLTLGCLVACALVAIVVAATVVWQQIEGGIRRYRQPPRVRRNHLSHPLP